MRTSRRGHLLRTAAFTSLLLATPALSQVPEGPFFTASGTRTASYMDAYNSWLAANVVPTQEMILGVNPSPFVSIEGDATKPNYNGDGATGPASIAIGQEAQATQASSLAIGTRARSLGERSVAIGVNANAAGSSSVIVGPSAGVNYTGTRSVGIGDSALNNAKGDNNLALGASAGADSDGTRNTSVGALNAGAGLRGDLNASFGFASAYNTTGSHNTSTGAYSGQNSSGDNNVSVGSNSGRFINGNNNTAVGYLAGNGPSINNRRNLTGATALGAGAQATSNYSIAIGAGEVDATTGNLTVPGATASGTNAIAIGRNSRTNAANTVVVGNAAQANSVQSTALGYQAISEGREGVVIGANAGTGTTTASNTQIAVGSSAGQRVDGLNSTAIGFQSGRDVVGNNNLAMGTRSGQNVTGSRNVVAGWESGQGVRGNNNLALGPQSGNNVNGFFNAAQGYWSGVGVQGSYNIAQGSGAGAYVVGSNNVAIGNRAGTNASAIESPSNGQPLFADTTTLNVADTIAIGSASLSSANFGIALGAGARANNVNSVALGANASTDAAVGTATGAIGTTTTTFAGTAPVGTLSIGSAGSERTLTNLAAGRVTAASTDAVNGSQLYATNQVVANNSTAIGTLQSDALQWDESISAFNAARAANATNKITNVTAGTLSDTSTDAVNGAQLYATNQAINNLSTTSAAGWNISADGANGTAVGTGSATGNSVDLANTDGNIVVAKTGSSNDVTFDLSDDVTIANSVSVGGNVINAAGATFNTLNAGGGQFVVNNGGAYYTGPITDDNHVVNKAYVDNSIVAASGDVNIGFAGNEGGVVRRTNGQDVAIVGEATTDGDYAGGNLRTVTDPATGAVQLQMAEAPRFGNVTINDGGTGRITGVTAAVLSNTSTHAVNGSQLVALGDSFAAAFGGNSAYDPTTNSFTARIAIGDVVYNNVQDAIQAAIRTAGGGGNGGNGGWSLNTGATGSGVVNNSNPATIAPGGSATFTAGDNIVLTQNGSEVQVAVNRNLNNMESISIANGPTINANGIDMNNRRITNLADGVDPGDAVNMRQFNAGLTDTLNKANVYTDNAINRLGGQLADIRRDANGGTAAAMAMGTLPQAYQPGANVVGMGVSTWDGEQALAVGYSRATSDGRYVLRASGTYNTRSQGGAAVGIGYQW